MNRQIVLVNIKTDRVVFPLSVLYVGTALKKAGFDVKIYNIAPSDDMDIIIEEILALTPLFVGFCVFTGVTATAAEISDKIKRLSLHTTIVWGGVHPSLVPRQCLEEDFVDIAVMGEGEITAVELAGSLKDNSDLRRIKGIGFKSCGEIIINELRPQIDSLDDYTLDWSLINVNDCVDILPDGTRSMSFMTSRGCPFNCGFCYNVAYNKKRSWRPHSIEYVKSQILHLKKISGMNGISLYDDHFMVDIERGLKIIDFLRENGIKCLKLEMRLDMFNERILDRLYDSGIRSLFIGWESGSERILKLINKGITISEVLEKFKLFRKYPDMAVSTPAIIGFPTETWGEICQTIDLGLKIAELLPSNHMVFQTFLPFPGTDLYPLAIKEGLNPPKRSIEWRGYHSFYGNMKLEWLPWSKKNTPEIFYRIDKYGKLLNHAPSSSLLRTIGKKICYFLAKTRLKYRIFCFPIEISILYRFNRYYLDLKGKLMKR